jgi:hypothetical protein
MVLAATSTRNATKAARRRVEITYDQAALIGSGAAPRTREARRVAGLERWRRRESNPRPQPRDNGFYERSRRSDLAPWSPRRPGCREPAS